MSDKPIAYGDEPIDEHNPSFDNVHITKAHQSITIDKPHHYPSDVNVTYHTDEVGISNPSESASRPCSASRQPLFPNECAVQGMTIKSR